MIVRRRVAVVLYINVYFSVLHKSLCNRPIVSYARSARYGLVVYIQITVYTNYNNSVKLERVASKGVKNKFCHILHIIIKLPY